jgi:DNA-directed RNA polymerase subunit RPC12/RpoP
MYTICSMGVETIGEAFSLGWRVTARRLRGRADGPSSRSSRECTYRKELDMETLVCTRGRAFPLSSLESRLRCPRCGNRRKVVMFQPPARAASA